MALGKRKIFHETFRHKRQKLPGQIKEFLKNTWQVIIDRKDKGDRLKTYFAIIIPLAGLIVVFIGIFFLNTSAPQPILHVESPNASISPNTSQKNLSMPSTPIHNISQKNNRSTLKISFLKILENEKDYENSVINLTGHLSYQLIHGEYMRLLVDDYGNKLKLTFYTSYDKELFPLDNITEEYYVVKGKFRTKYPLDAIDVHNLSYVYESNVGGYCNEDSNCKTPIEFVMQSNCAFTSACVNNKCKVICPFTFPDPNPQANKTYPVPCQEDYDCDCSIRHDRWLQCLCLDGGCVSVEAE